MIYNLTTPAAVLELDACENNIKKLIEDCKKYQICHRPHFKTHKSVYLAKLQQRFGAVGFTAAKLGEAEVLADNGFDDVLLCYPIIGEDKLARLFELSKRITIRTIVNSYIGAKMLSDYFVKNDSKIDVLIDIDGGMKRGGLLPYQPTVDFAKSISALEGIKIVGIAYYDGAIYGAKTENEIIEHIELERNKMLTTADMLRKAGFRIDILSGGSSFSSKYPSYLKGITEVRAGNYIFNDLAQMSKGLVSVNDCALRVVVTVVSKVDEFNFIIDAGSKTLSSDLVYGKAGYGYIIEYPDSEITALNEEHGFVRFAKENQVEIGDKLTIIPNHSCIIPNIFDSIFGVRNGKVETIIKTEARGKNS